MTGTYPWTYRAFQINSKVYSPNQDRNVFNLFNDYHRITYSHNQLVNILQQPLLGDIDTFKPREDLTLGENKWISRVFRADEDAATVSWARSIGNIDMNYSSSLFFSNLFNFMEEKLDQQMSELFPLGLPVSSLDKFLLEDFMDWLISEIDHLPTPFLGYIHFLPPHAPYNTRREFVGEFEGTSLPFAKKPGHTLALKGRKVREYGLDTYRQRYDEFILYVDLEFNRLYKALERSGLTETSIIILTSDHGEMFEREILGHSTPSLHEPLVHIPLLIFNPGQENRVDIQSNTSAVDILPTLLHLAGKQVPPWVEGIILPPHQVAENDRSIFALEAKTNKPDFPITSASAMIIKDNWKLTKYFGYNYLPRNEPLIELYNLDNDPQELNELSRTKDKYTRMLVKELENIIISADQEIV